MNLQYIPESPSKSPQFLILTEPHNRRTKHLNHTARSYSGLDVSQHIPEGFCFYSTCLHPEDLQNYQTHLTSLTGSEEKEIDLRIKNKRGEWETFRFRDRIYQPSGSPFPMVLSVGSPVGLSAPDINESFNKDDFELLVNSLDEGFCMVEIIYDENGEPYDYLYLTTNPAFEKQVDFKNVTGKTVRELVEEPNKEWLKMFHRVAQSGSPSRIKEHNPNLGDVWLDLYAFKMGESDCRKVGILFRNITQEKKEEERLRFNLEQNLKDLKESKELLQNVFDTTNLAIAVLQAVYDEEGNFLDFIFIRTNKVLQDMYLEEDIVGKSYLETSTYGVELGIFEAYQKTIETGQTFDEEFYLNKERYNNWFRVTARSHNDLLITSIEDITERKKRAKELEETMRFKQELVRATPEIIMIIDLNTFSVRYINKDIVPEAGLTRESVKGKRLDDILPYIHPRDREKVMELHRSLLKSSEDQILDIEVRLKLKGIVWEWFNVRGKVFKRKNKNWVDEYVLLVRNITDQKNTQKALMKAEKLSIQGEIARTFAHELRNPLASIGMVGEVLKHRCKGSEEKELKSYLEILKRSTDTLNNLVTELLNSSNYTPSVLKENDLVLVLNDTLEKAADRIYLSGVQVTKKYAGPYPILADKEKLEIALLNIVVNASEATKPGEGLILIEITQQDAFFELSISDNGHGMEQDQIDHLFEAFYSNKETGVGVGLSSVKNILEEHDAQIKVLSKPNQGTTFKIYFHNAESI